MAARLMARIPPTLPAELLAEEEQVAKNVSAVAVEGESSCSISNKRLTHESYCAVAGADTVST